MMSCLPAAREVGDVRGDRRLQLQLAALDLLHGDERGEQLRHGGQVVDRVLGRRDLLVGGELHTRVGLVVVGRVAHGLADRLVESDRSTAAGEQYGARVPGVLGGGGEELLGVGDELAQMPGDQTGPLRGPAAQCGSVPLGVPVRLCVRRGGGPRRERGEGQCPAQCQHARAQLATGEPVVRVVQSVRRAVGHERTPSESIFRDLARRMKLSCQVTVVSSLGMTPQKSDAASESVFPRSEECGILRPCRRS